MTLQELAKKHGEVYAIKQLQKWIRQVESTPRALQWHTTEKIIISLFSTTLGEVIVDVGLKEDRRLIDTAIARNKLQGYTPKGNP